MKIHNLNDLLNVAYAATKRFDLQRAWWRGQACAEWEITPRLYHKGFDGSEHHLTLLFQSKARVRHENCPGPDDWPGWLLLMQHCGLPTRLLNWSESVLVAAYFAVCEERYWNSDGSLFCLDPTRLNEKQAARRGLLVQQDLEAARLFEEAFRNGEVEKNTSTLAVLTDQLDVRNVVQHSTYTIHGSSQPLERMEGNHLFLEKHEIPAAAKEELFRSLDLLGIRKSFLFPDLEHLALDVQSVRFE